MSLALMLGNSLVSPNAATMGGASLDEAALLYLFDEGSGDDVINHGTLAPDGTVDAGTITYEPEGAVISVTAGTGSVDPQTLTTTTYFSAFKLGAASTSEYGLFAFPANDLMATVKINPGVPKFRFGDTNCSASFTQLYDDQWHILEGVYDGATIKLLLDGVTLMETAAADKEAAMENLVVGAFNNGGGIFPGVHGVQALFDTALTPSKRASIRSQIRTLMEDRGASFVNPHQVLLLGDSIIDSIDSGLITYAGLSYPHSRNMAVGGYDIADITAQLPDIRRQAAGFPTTIVLAVGRNCFGGAEETNYIPLLQELVGSLKAIPTVEAVLVCSILPFTASGGNTWRNSKNADIRTNDGDWHDGCIDNGADLIIGTDAAAADTNIYSDGTHFEPTGPGYERMARNIKAGLDLHFGVELDVVADVAPDQYLHAIDSTLTPRTDGVGIDTWEDLGSAGEDGIGQVSHKPTYDADGINGGPSIAFSGDQTFYHNFAIGGSTGIATYMFVISVDATANFKGFYATKATGTDHKEILVVARCISSANWGIFDGGDEPANSNIQGDGALVLTVVRTGLGGSYFNNGASDGAFTDAIGQAQAHIGGLYGAGQAFTGKMGVVLAKRDYIPTPGEQRRLEAKFAADFGITLP